MTSFLVRKVSDVWKHRLADDELSPQMEALPAWALGEFVPKITELDNISVYEVPKIESIVALAAALGAMLEKPSATVWAYLATDVARDAGLQWVVDKNGTTPNLGVNDWHASLSIASSEDLDKVVRTFAGGQIYTCEKRLAETELERAVRSNEISVVAPSKDVLSANPYKKLALWASNGWLEVKGVPAN